MSSARNVKKVENSRRVGKARSGYNKGTIRGDLRYLVVSKDVRRHRLISIDYITTLPVTAEVASSSLVVPAISFQAVTRKEWFPRSVSNRFNRSRKRIKGPGTIPRSP